MDIIEKNPNEYDGLAIAKRVEGSIYEVTSIYGKGQIDLSDLASYSKDNSPDEIKGVSFEVFRFGSGETILHALYVLHYDGIGDDGRPMTQYGGWAG